MRLQDYDTGERFTATVVSTELLSAPSAPEVRELTLDLDRPLDAVAGQSVGVLAPGEGAFGQRVHFRLYTLADQPEPTATGSRVRIAVRRCSRIDAYSGVRYLGVASNYLCDLRAGDEFVLSGPYGMPFEAPGHEGALVLIGMGTGIAPFRALVRSLNAQAWGGRVILFHGGHTGLDLLYQNQERDDFAQYMDGETFEAIKVLSRRPHWDEDADWAGALQARGEEIWDLLGKTDTAVYLAGLESISEELDTVLAFIAGSTEAWRRRKAELVAGGRWVELLY